MIHCQLSSSFISSSLFISSLQHFPNYCFIFPFSRCFVVFYWYRAISPVVSIPFTFATYKPFPQLLAVGLRPSIPRCYSSSKKDIDFSALWTLIWAESFSLILGILDSLPFPALVSISTSLFSKTDQWISYYFDHPVIGYGTWN